MLTARRRLPGFTMIELMIAIALFLILLMLGAPAFMGWIQSSQIRGAADAVQSGLMVARAEAVRRNTTVNFQLVTTVDNACAVSTSGRNWVVSQDNPAGKCGDAPSDTVAPRIIQKRAAIDGSSNAVLAADLATITFNGYGQATNLAAATAAIAVTNPTGGNCVTAGGDMRCLRVGVTAGGQVRTCDPALSSPDPRAC